MCILINNLAKIIYFGEECGEVGKTESPQVRNFFYFYFDDN